MSHLDRVDYKLLALLNGGQTIPGPKLGNQLGISRAAVWKRITELKGLGIPIQSVRGRGYTLSLPVECLDANLIRNELLMGVVSSVRSLSVVEVTESTNRDIKALPESEQHAAVVLAEYQSAGRGRRGRQWVSPFAANCYLSIGWRFRQSPAELGCLSLAVGVMVKRAINGLGVADVSLKWPNDIRIEGRKLGGCLIEIAGDQTGPANAIVGVGINVAMPRETVIDQPWINLKEIKPEIGRNTLAITLIRELIEGLTLFEQSGFTPFAGDWALADELLDRPVQIIRDDAVITGVARGISGQGGLIIDVNGEMTEFHSGDASVRSE